MRRTFKILSLLFIFIFVFALASCSRPRNVEPTITSNDKTYEYYINSDDRIIVYSANYSFGSSEKKIQDEQREVKNYINSISGYIVNLNTYSDHSTFTYRVPVDKFFEFTDFIDNRANYFDKSVTGYDATTTSIYYINELEDLTSRRAAYAEMLDDESVTISEKITINDLINDIDDRLSKLNELNNELEENINYSKVTINYYVKDNSSDFVKLVKKIFKYVLVVLVIVSPFAVIGLVIFFILKKKNKKVEA